MPKAIRAKSHFKEREVTTAIAICRAEPGDRVVVHKKDGSIDFILEADYVQEIRLRMVKELTKSGAIPAQGEITWQN